MSVAYIDSLEISNKKTFDCPQIPVEMQPVPIFTFLTNVGSGQVLNTLVPYTITNLLRPLRGSFRK